VFGARGDESPHVQCPRLGTIGNHQRGKQEMIFSQQNCHACSLPPPSILYSTVRKDDGMGCRRILAYLTSGPQCILSHVKVCVEAWSVSRLLMRLCVLITFTLDAQEPSQVDNGYRSKETTVHCEGSVRPGSSDRGAASFNLSSTRSSSSRHAVHCLPHQ